MADGDKRTTVGGFALKNLSLCYEESFGIPFDSTIEVSDGRGIRDLKVHKFVLGLHSEVLYRKALESKSSIKIESEDLEAFEVLIKFCYNIRDPLPDKSVQFLIAVFKDAETFHIPELQQRCFTLVSSYNRRDLFLESVDLALQNSHLPLLCSALYSRAKRLMPHPTPLFLSKYRDNPNRYHHIVSCLDLPFYICENCKELECLNRSPVTLRNFVPGALVMVAEPRSGRGLAAIHRLESILSHQKRQFMGLLKSGIRTPVLTLDQNVYIYNCSNL